MDTQAPQQQTFDVIEDFATAEARVASPARLREIVKDLLRNPQLWKLLEPHVVRGTAGRVQFDQGIAAFKLRQFDTKNGAKLDAFDGLNEVELWKIMKKELARVYDMKQGRIVGRLPDKTTQPK